MEDSAALALATASGATLQRKLAVGAADDAFEHEADRIADAVLRRPGAGGPKPDGAPLRLSRDTPPSASLTAPPSVDRTLAAPGRPLDARSRAYFEPRFGADLSAVRIHDNAAAAASAHAVNANAYTVDHHIVFAAGRHDPGTVAGNRLLAHELTHVLQTTGHRLRRQTPTTTHTDDETTRTVTQPVTISESVTPAEAQSAAGSPAPTAAPTSDPTTTTATATSPAPSASNAAAAPAAATGASFWHGGRGLGIDIQFAPSVVGVAHDPYNVSDPTRPLGTPGWRRGLQWGAGDMSFPVNLILLPREFHLFGTERFNIGFEPQIVVTAAVVPHTGSFDATHPDPWHLQPGLSIAVDLLHWKISDAIDWHILQAGGLLQGDFPLGAGPSPAFGWGGQGGTGFEFALPHPGAPDESWTIGFNLTGQLLATSGGPTSFTGFGTVFLTRHIRHHTPESHTTATPVPSAGSPPRPAPPPTPQPPQSEQTPEVPAPVAVPPGSDALLENASPWLARAVGSDSLEGFPTGVAQPTPALAFQAGVLAHTIVELLGRFPGSTIRVIGHTDTVGTRAANAALGLDRALAVKAELVRLGVPAELITVDSAGEGPPQATPTRDGVPMASNRRVRVVFEPRTGLWH